MLKINLLPVSERPVDRTPLPRFLLILATAVVGAGLTAYIALLVFNDSRPLDQIMEERKKELRSYDGDVAEHDQLEAAVKQARARIKEKDQFAGRDIAWNDVVSAVWDIVADRRHERIWFDEIKVLDEKAVQQIIKKGDPQAKQYPPYALQIKCHAAGVNIQDITRFRLDLKKNEILRKTLPSMTFNPDFRVTAEKDYVEEFSMTFEVYLFPEVQAAPTRKPPGK